MLKLFIGKDPAEVTIFKFPAGESGVSFKWDDSRTHTEVALSCKISLKFESNEDIINLALLVDAIRRKHPQIEINLDMPYFPYARQDRVCNPGESLSVKVVADIINSLNLTRVYVTDPHSDVLGAVLNNMVQLDVSYSIKKALTIVYEGQGCKLVSPDAGALKKIYRYAKECSGVDVVRADKSRDTHTGKITGTVVYSEHLGKTNLMVVDDICDGGGTFVPLAQELRKITDGTVSLFVTHGLFTKGVDIVADVFDNVFVVNNLYGPHTKLKEI